MSQSYWEIISPGVSYPALRGDIRPGVAVVGGGITGLTAALLLAEHGVGVAVLDTGRVGSGSSGRSTGKITLQHNDIYGKLTCKPGRAAASGYLREMQAACEFIKVRHDQFALPYDKVDNIVFAATAKGKERLMADIKAAMPLGLNIGFRQTLGLPIKYLLAAGTDDQLAINPKAYCNALAAEIVRLGGKIYEHTTVMSISEGNPALITTSDGCRVWAAYVVQALGYPIMPKIGSHLLRLRPVRSHLMAFRLKSAIPEGMYISLDTPLPTLRTHSHMGNGALIIGGLSGRTGSRDKSIYHRIEAYARARFDIGKTLAAWGAQDYQTPDSMPYVGLSSIGSRVYTAVGFNKWGLTGGTAAGISLAGAIIGGGFANDHPFSPRRMSDLFTFKAAGNLIEAGAHFASRLALHTAMPSRAGESRILLLGGRRCGAYRSGSGELFVLSATCTHLGCPLNFNATEQSWDCPCHGSRFGVDGSVICGPALEPLERIEL